MIPRFPVYLFDVDGTLVDSAADICGAIRTVLGERVPPHIDDNYLKSYIGRHLIDLFTEIFPDDTPEEREALIQQYRCVYPTRQHASTLLYPGVGEALAQLGGRKSTATTKGTPTTRIVLEKFGLLSYFDHVQGTDGFPAKPAPDVIQASLRHFGIDPAEVLMIGDAAPDMAAGRAAGVKTCAVTYGYGKRDDLARYEPDYWVDDLRQLVT